MNWQETRDFLEPCFPESIRQELELLEAGELREIRVRADRPTVFVTAARTVEMSWRPGLHQLSALAEALSGHSLYARSEETGQGFVTLRGGHRMGLCGRVLRRKSGTVLSDTGSLCLRIAAEWPGCADVLMSRLQHCTHAASVLIIGAPGSGKTTLLRDTARQLASGHGARQIAVVDERGELAACVNGIPQLNIGASADVLEGLPKTEAIPWLLRSMSPDVILTDELSGAEDAAAIMDAQACGAAVCATVHGSSLQDAASRPALAALMSRRAFDVYAVLSPDGSGRICALHDRTGSPLSVA
ncbi:MAG: Flp pilus assembly complex ATPase component TadA [Clostridia bacterium]|nr:Flp pilus assembly complex ATPase component TadA [Clostridia bacterium]